MNSGLPSLSYISGHSLLVNNFLHRILFLWSPNHPLLGVPQGFCLSGYTHLLSNLLVCPLLSRALLSSISYRCPPAGHLRQHPSETLTSTQPKQNSVPSPAPALPPVPTDNLPPLRLPILINDTTHPHRNLQVILGSPLSHHIQLVNKTHGFYPLTSLDLSTLHCYVHTLV